MRLKRYITVSQLLFIAITSFACGWWPTNSGNVLLYRIMPLDETDYEKYSTTWESDYMLHSGVDYKADNLRLWQKQTSLDLCIDDIEFIVYKADIGYLQNIEKQESHQDNSFAKWIVANKRTDIIDFLILAKQSEEVRFSINDPWYYDVKDSYHYKILEDVTEKCRQYKFGPLLGRYALQMVRALCTLRKYEECAQYWDRIKGKLSNDAIKKMTELRAASALYKVGREDEALEIYTRHGDVASVRAVNGGQIENELEFVYEHNPNSPYLEEELQKWLIYFGDDSTEKGIKNGYYYSGGIAKLESLLKVAHRAVNERKTKKMAMWYYTLAALYDTKGEPVQAKKYLARGIKYHKSPFLRDSYHVLQMWLDAKTSTYNQEYEQRLLNDLRWLDNMIKNKVTPEIYDKLNHDHIWQQEYNDDNRDVYQNIANTFYWNDALRRLLLKVVCPRMHEAGKYIREIQLANVAENLLVKTNGYSGEMFVIMDRLPYIVTRDYFSRIYHPKDNFDRFLNDRSRTDKFYWYDVLATKCIRERRYTKALVYLKQIPVSFQQKMSVYPYMDKDPFSYQMDTYKHDSLLAPNYKLHFAEKMAEHERTMKRSHDINILSEAKIQYALGLRNSVHNCWFLTRHSSTTENDMIRNALPDIPYPEDSTIYRHNEYIKLSEEMINEAIAQYTDKEMAAKQLRKFQRYQRILDNYGETATAKDIRRHCDRWRDYALNTNKKTR